MIIDIPAGTDPTSDKMAILLAELLHATGLTKERRQGHFINWHSDDLRKLLGRRYCEIVREAHRLGYVELNPRYAVGRFSKSIRLARPYRHPKTAPYALRRQGKLSCLHRIRLNEDDVIGRSLVAHFDDVSLPPQIVNRSKGWALFSARSVLRGNLYATRCEHGRLHTTFTGMPRKIRRRLRIEGKPITDIDVANCQPLLVGLMAKRDKQQAGQQNKQENKKKNIKQQDKPCVVQASPHGWCGRERSRCSLETGPKCRIVSTANTGSVSAADDEINQLMHPEVIRSTDSADVDAFISLCASGVLYETLLTPCQSRGLTLWDFIPEKYRHRYATDRPLTRNSIKKGFVTMLFSPNDAMLRMPLFDLLVEQFPSIAQFIVDAKQERHADLAKACQRFESSLMIDGVAADLVEQIPMLTIHDAIVAKKEDADLVDATIREHFARLGVGVKVKRGD
jgi:hypothetical protein